MLTNHLGDPFRGAHGIFRIDRLVRRNEYERFTTEFIGEPGNYRRAKNVVHRRGSHLRFQHRDMLIGRGMKDDVGHVALQRSLDTRGITYVRQHYIQCEIRETLPEFTLDGK